MREGISLLQAAVLHLPYGAFAYAVSDHHARIMLRAKRGDLRACYVIHEDRYRAPGTYQTLQLSHSGSDEMFDYFQATVESETKRIRYRFLLDDGIKRLWYGETGMAENPGAAGWFQLAYLCARDQYSIPAWVDEGDCLSDLSRPVLERGSF
jgi:cyclomaltodextrinase